MPFSTYCTNKGCGKMMEPYLDLATDKVHCSNCDGEIPNITHFTKMQMKSSKQYKQKAKAFAFRCPSCKITDRPKIVNDDAVCTTCNKSLNLSPIFVNMLKEQLKTADQDVK